LSTNAVRNTHALSKCNYKHFLFFYEKKKYLYRSWIYLYCKGLDFKRAYQCFSKKTLIFNFLKNSHPNTLFQTFSLNLPLFKRFLNLLFIFQLQHISSVYSLNNFEKEINFSVFFHRKVDQWNPSGNISNWDINFKLWWVLWKKHKVTILVISKAILELLRFRIF